MIDKRQIVNAFNRGHIPNDFISAFLQMEMALDKREGVTLTFDEVAAYHLMFRAIDEITEGYVIDMIGEA